MKNNSIIIITKYYLNCKTNMHNYYNNFNKPQKIIITSINNNRYKISNINLWQIKNIHYKYLKKYIKTIKKIRKIKKEILIINLQIVWLQFNKYINMKEIIFE
jgi:hypothetical protein